MDLIRSFVVTALAVTFVGPATAGMVPGGGNTSTDCYAELEVVGIDPDAVKGMKKVVCTDGEPCDTGVCGDGVCDFKVRLCWNQNEPLVDACIPPRRLDSLQLRGQLAAVMVMPETFEGSACGAEYVDFGVATRGVGTRPGRMMVRLTALAPEDTEPRSDVDRIRLVCKPRKVETCPMPAVTSTTTVGTTSTAVGSTDTTTTVTATTALQTTTTRRRRTTTTTTVAVPTTTFPLPTTTFVLPTTTFVLPTTTFVLPTTLPDTTLVPTTTAPVVTTTTDTTSTTERDDDDKHGRGGGDHLLGIDLPLL